MQENLLKIVLWKTSYPFHFQLAIRKRDEENKFRLYVLEGSENLGSYLKLKPCSDKAPQLPNCSIQWYRLSSEGTWKEIISGIYAIIFLHLVIDLVCAMWIFLSRISSYD